jgi:MFS family permease
MTITPVHMSEHAHALGAISLVIMAHTLGMFGLSFVTGWLVDRLGRNPIILIGGVMSAAACAIAPISTSTAWLALALFLLGLGWNFSFVGGSALLDDLLRPSEKGRVQGLVDAVVKIASGAGSLGSGVLFAWSSFAATSLLTVVVAVMPVLLVLFARMRQPLAVGGSAAD